MVTADSYATLASFDKTETAATWSWAALNDPVMGGQSHSTLNINNGIAVWNGETKIVPKLHAPGFCNVKSTSGGGILRIANDASPFTHMLLRVRSTIKYTGFKVSFAADTWNPTFKSFKSDFTVQRNDGVWHTVAVPFEKFSNDWSQYTGRCDTTDPNGKKHKCCSAEHPEVCPTKSNLKHISQLGLWAEGVAGKFHLEVKWIRAGTVFDKSIVEVAAGNKDLSTLVTALTAGKLVTALEGKGPFTVFAPSNEAFAKLPKDQLKNILDPQNIKTLDSILEYHVISGAAVHSTDLKASQHVTTLQGESLLVEKDWSGVHVNRKAKVTTADVGASNGVVHIIDTVLIPTSVSHPKPTENIVQIASGNKDLSTLVTALTAGKLVTALEGKGPFTVFAPSNEAFAKLPDSTLKRLLDPQNIKLLDSVLEYHVISGAAIYSKDLKPSQHVATLQGESLLVDVHWSGVYINRKAQVTTADVGATNGVVHIIDTVLVPPNTKIDACTIDVPKQLQFIYGLEFAALDSNHDGSLSPSEFKGARLKLAEVFERLRKSGGRRLGMSSWLKALQRKRQQLQYQRDAARAARVFNKFDDDHDHSISKCEYENAMYQDKFQNDMFQNSDGPVVVHG